MLASDPYNRLAISEDTIEKTLFKRLKIQGIYIPLVKKHCHCTLKSLNWLYVHSFHLLTQLVVKITSQKGRQAPDVTVRYNNMPLSGNFEVELPKLFLLSHVQPSSLLEHFTFQEHRNVFGDMSALWPEIVPVSSQQTVLDFICFCITLWISWSIGILSTLIIFMYLDWIWDQSSVIRADNCILGFLSISTCNFLHWRRS